MPANILSLSAAMKDAGPSQDQDLWVCPLFTSISAAPPPLKPTMACVPSATGRSEGSKGPVAAPMPFPSRREKADRLPLSASTNAEPFPADIDPAFAVNGALHTEAPVDSSKASRLDLEAAMTRPGA